MVDIDTQPDFSPEDTPVERVAQAADDIAQTFAEAEGTEARSDLLHVVAEKLEAQGVTLVDLHAAFRDAGELSPDSLPNQAGAKSGRTRAQILAGIALNRPTRYRRR